MAVPATRLFEVFQRGYVRDDVILETIRLGLADLIDPETGATFTTERIRVATQVGSRDWLDADAIDVLSLIQQARALVIADQVRPDRANSNFLRQVWAPLYKLSPLDGEGGRGDVTWAAPPGTIFAGSTTIPDPLGIAHTLTDPANNLYQVRVGGVVGADGSIVLDVQAINVGEATNVLTGTVMTGVNKPLGAATTATVSTDFSGGSEDETDAELLARLLDVIRYRPASGNAAHFRAWVREVSVNIERAFVYPTFAHAGSVLVVPIAKRGSTLGPTARFPDSDLLTRVTGRVVPPASPVVPGRAYVLVKAATSVPSDLVARLSLRRGSATGWDAATPWPGYTSSPAAITAVSSQSDFTMSSDTTLPGGVASLTAPDAPTIMVWDDTTSRFEQLFVQTITDLGGGSYHVVLSVDATKTLAIGDRISPYSNLATLIAEGFESYFDSLGPGEVIDLATDPRADRAFRFPETREEQPAVAGQSVLTKINEALKFASAAATLDEISVTDPGLPADVTDGPNQVTLGKVMIADYDV